MIQQIGSEEQESNTRKDVADHTNLEFDSTGPDTSQLFGMCQHSHGATGQPNTPEKRFAEPARVRVTAQAS